MSFLLAEFTPWLIGAGATILAFVVAYFRGRGDGKKLERSKQTEAQLKLREAYDEVDSDSRSVDDAYQRLRGNRKR